jgi:hypothetical protein
MHARLGGARQAWTRRQRGSSVAVRGNADGAHRPPQLRAPTVVSVRTDRRKCARRPSQKHGRPSAMRPWTAQHDGPQRDKVTHHGTKEKRSARSLLKKASSWALRSGCPLLGGARRPAVCAEMPAFMAYRARSLRPPPAPDLLSGPAGRGSGRLVRWPAPRRRRGGPGPSRAGCAGSARRCGA